MATTNKLGFDILSDAGNAYARKLGLVWEFPQDLKQAYLSFPVDLESFNGDDSWTLPMPARFIVDGSGIIRFSDAHPDYTRRPEPEDTLEKVRALGN
jgi:peroxiredoxin